MKLLFCDIDGTLTETISGHAFKQHPKDLKVIEGADRAIARFHSQGYTIIGVSNQGGVAAGHKVIEDAIAEMQCTLQLIPQLSCIYFCPDFAGLECWRVEKNSAKQIEQFSTVEFGSFRKPGAGMIKLATNRYQLDIESLMVGDRLEDEQSATNAGIKFMSANVWRNT